MTRQYACQPATTLAEVMARNCSCSLASPTDDDLVTELIDVASDVLARLSQLEVRGRCTVTVRPLGDALCVPSSHNTIHGIDAIPLRGPATEIVEISIDGVVLNPSEYGLMDDVYLFRQDGYWPRVNMVKGTANDFGVFEIVYRFGHPWNWLGRQAAVDLVCMFHSVLTGKSNELPNGVVNASLQGVSVAIDTLANDVERIAGDLSMVSQWLGAFVGGDVNRGVSGVWSPELDMGWELVEVEGPSGS